LLQLYRQRAERLRRRRATRSKPRRSARRKRRYRRQAPSEARDRALAALKTNPAGTTSELAKTAGVSRATVVNASKELAREARKAARKQARKPREPAKEPDRCQRAQRFLREQLARGPQSVSDLEEAAGKAHLDPRALEQARADLGIVTSRANAGGVQAVQWSLPG
jgi:DNA-binding XRE family transcriptional regulator